MYEAHCAECHGTSGRGLAGGGVKFQSAHGTVVSRNLTPDEATGLAGRTDEDRHAVVVYLRHLPPVRHAIPDPDHTTPLAEPGAVERAYAGRNYGTED